MPTFRHIYQIREDSTHEQEGEGRMVSASNPSAEQIQ